MRKNEEEGVVEMSLLALATAYDSEEDDEMGDPTPLSKRRPGEEKVRREMSGNEEYAEPDSKKTKNMDGRSKELKTEYEEPTGLSLLKKDLKSEYGELVLLKKEVKSEHSDLEAEDKKQEPSVEKLFHQKEVKSEYSELGAKNKEQEAYNELKEEYCESNGGTCDISSYDVSDIIRGRERVSFELFKELVEAGRLTREDLSVMRCARVVEVPGNPDVIQFLSVLFSSF